MRVISPPSRRTAAIVAMCLAAATFAFGTKLILIGTYGSGVPYMDEWDGIGLSIFAPRAGRALHASDFFQPHNEHRVALTRLIAYGLAAANGQWDPLLEMAVNAALHAGFCAALLLFARRFLTGARLVFAALAITALFSLAFDWENTIEGFQSQFTLLEWCALGMFWLCLTARPLSARWFLGYGAGIAALGTMSSGFFAAPVTLGVMALEAAFRKRWSWRDSAAAALLAAIAVAGLALFNPVPWHENLKADSAGEWLRGLATVLAWPTFRWPLALIVLQMPIVVFLAGRLRARRLGPAEAPLLALTGWVWLQIGALAYGRAKMGLLTSPRFSDLFAIESVVNILALAALWRPRPAAVGAGWTLLGLGWLGLFAAGLGFETRQGYSEYLGAFPRQNEAYRRHIGAYLASGDMAALTAVPIDELPYPVPGTLASALDSPGIRPVLSVDIRPPLPIVPTAQSSGFSRVSPDGLPAGVVGNVWIARRGPAKLVSQPMSTGNFSLLHLEFCGSGDLDSSLVSLQSTQERVTAPAAPLSEHTWHATDLPVPPGMFVRLVVDVPAGDHWFALTQPVEIGRGSSAVRWLLRRASGLTLAAGVAFGAALAALLAVDLTERSRNRSPAPAASA